MPTWHANKPAMLRPTLEAWNSEHGIWPRLEQNGIWYQRFLLGRAETTIKMVGGLGFFGGILDSTQSPIPSTIYSFPGEQQVFYHYCLKNALSFEYYIRNVRINASLRHRGRTSVQAQRGAHPEAHSGWTAGLDHSQKTNPARVNREVPRRAIARELTGAGVEAGVSTQGYDMWSVMDEPTAPR